MPAQNHSSSGQTQSRLVKAGQGCSGGHPCLPSSRGFPPRRRAKAPLWRDGGPARRRKPYANRGEISAKPTCRAEGGAKAEVRLLASSKTTRLFRAAMMPAARSVKVSQAWSSLVKVAFGAQGGVLKCRDEVWSPSSYCLDATSRLGLQSN
jgi:hypothetical protein